MNARKINTGHIYFIKKSSRNDVWFPKMYARKEWINILVENETIIYETNEDSIKNKEFVNKWINQKRNIRYVFTYAKDSLGMVLYRFKGVFELDKGSNNT